MDFVKKKAFEAHLNKFGKDLGLSSNITSGFSSSRTEQERSSQWSAFPSMRSAPADEEAPAPETDTSPFPTRATETFDARSKNFPPLLNLFYVDRSILSAAAREPVDHAFRVLGILTALLGLNFFTNALYTGLDKGTGWVDLLIGAIVALLLLFAELFAFETAFRGAYRNSENLRKRYLFCATGNVVVFALYAFLGASFFNGWASAAGIDELEGSRAYRNWKRTLIMVEAFGWTALSLYNVYTLFEFYHLYNGREQGLSQQALDDAIRGVPAAADDPSFIVPEGDAERRSGTRSSRVQEIRDRYRTPDFDG